MYRRDGIGRPAGELGRDNSLGRVGNGSDGDALPDAVVSVPFVGPFFCTRISENPFSLCIRMKVASSAQLRPCEESVADNGSLAVVELDLISVGLGS